MLNKPAARDTFRARLHAVKGGAEKDLGTRHKGTQGHGAGCSSARGKSNRMMMVGGRSSSKTRLPGAPAPPSHVRHLFWACLCEYVGVCAGCVVVELTRSCLK